MSSRREALIITISDGPELFPQAAFAASAFRALGMGVTRLSTDFCTTQEAFKAAIADAQPAAVALFEAPEWSEIIATFVGWARETVTAPVLVLDGDAEAAAMASLGPGRPLPGPADLPMDYGPFGGAGLLARAMGCSLFGDVGTVALLSNRVRAGAVSPTSALARLEGALAAGPSRLTRSAALAPLEALSDAAVSVEWWDRRLDAAALPLLREVRERGVPQSVRLPATEARTPWLEELRAHGVTRVVFECDALEENGAAGSSRLPGAAATAVEVEHACARAAAAGLSAGVLLVVGLPGETQANTESRCEVLRSSPIERLRVVPFEPAGEACEWCRARDLWPPVENRWNREVHQPLRQPELRDVFPAMLESALLLLAEVEARRGRPA